MILFFFHSHCIRFTFVSPSQRLKVKGVTAKKKKSQKALVWIVIYRSENNKYRTFIQLRSVTGEVQTKTDDCS